MEQESKDKKPNVIIETIEYLSNGLMSIIVICIVIFGIWAIWGAVSDAVEGDCMVITNHQSYIEYEFMKINGSIQNNCDNAKRSRITATFFDAQNRILGTDGTYTQYKERWSLNNDIPIASTGRFELSTYGEPINLHNVDHYKLVVEREHYETSWIAIPFGIIIIVGVYFNFFAHTCLNCGKWLSFRPKICPRCKTNMRYKRLFE